MRDSGGPTLVRVLLVRFPSRVPTWGTVGWNLAHAPVSGPLAFVLPVEL